MLLEMLKYMRPEGSDTQREFCEVYLDPIMGNPDQFGNYVLEVGEAPTIAFMAHHDTVHKSGGYQTVLVDDEGYAYVPSSSCLGADCTTGVWLILEMIKAQVPGVYVVHAAEEVGCVGSSSLVKSKPSWLSRINVAMSFDRWGTQSIITHQLDRRTASEKFAVSLEDTLNLKLSADDGGSYTDSNEYADIVPECTNVSVGYYSQHTKKECQDLDYAYKLRDALISADWSGLVIDRDPLILEYASDYKHYYGGGSYNYSDYRGEFYDPMTDLVEQHPEEVAGFLRDLGYSTYDMLDELALSYDQGVKNVG